MTTQTRFALSSTTAQFGSVFAGDSVSGGGSLVDTNRLVSAQATGSVKESYIADALSAAYVLSIGGTLTAARTVTVPDASLTIAGQDYANVFTAAQTVSVAGGLTVRQASTQDAVAIIGRAGGTSSYVATLTPGTLTGSVTLTLPASTTTIAGLAVAQTWTATQAFAAITGTTITASAGFVGGTGTFSSVTNSSLTSGRVPVAGTAGLMGDFSTLTYASGTGLVADQLTSSGLTSGRITTAGTAGKLQDFAGLAIVGTPSATAPSTATGGQGNLNGVAIVGADAAASTWYSIGQYGNGSAVSIGLLAYVGQGTAASPAAAASNDRLILQLRGYDGTAYSAGQANVVLRVGSAWTNTSHETTIDFGTTPSGSTGVLTAGRVDGNQTLVWGGAFNGVGTFSAGTQRPHIQTAATSANNCNIAQTFWAANGNGPTGIFAKSRSGTVGTQGVITTGDTLGTLSWQGDDGTNFIAAAQISVAATGTITTGQVPGIMRLATANSAGTMISGQFIDSAQVSIFTNASTATGSALFTGGTITPRVQVFSSASVPGSAALISYAASALGPSLYLGKSRSTTPATMTVVNVNDVLGTIDWQGADGTNFVSGAQIVVTATGTPASTRMGTSMLFKTATDAAPSVMTTALTIDNTQQCTFAGNVTFTDAKNLIFGSSTGCKIGTATTQKIAFWNASPVAQYATTGTTTGFSAGAGTAVDSAATFTGNTGSTAYTISDVVRALKLCGVMAA